MQGHYKRWTRDEEHVVRAVMDKEPNSILATRQARDALMAARLSLRSLASVASFMQKLKKGYTVAC